MREPAFLRQNKEKWTEYEQLLFSSEGKPSDPDRLAALYIQLTDDLAYARTFYPRSQTTRYLNGLAARTHLAIYRNKAEKRNRFMDFFGRELPLIYFHARRELWTAFGVFSFVFLIGLLTAINDDAFVRAIMGDGYVNMTIRNIKAGDPMGVYKEEPSLPMFLSIAVNNIRVSFLAFAGGIFLSVGTLYLLFNNGIMVGAFFGLFYLHGDLAEALPVIYIHGTLELSAIVIAGAAGFKLGNSILFPGTHSRKRSLQQSAREGVKMILGLVPVFLVAAWLESYITRLTAWPLWAKMIVILASLAYIIWYYILLPWQVHQRVTREASPSESTQDIPSGWFDPAAS